MSRKVTDELFHQASAMKRSSDYSGWFYYLIFGVCGGVLVSQFSTINGSFVKKLIIFLISFPIIAFVLWIFFRTGIFSWAEKWVNSSFNDFLREIEKTKSDKVENKNNKTTRSGT